MSLLITSTIPGTTVDTLTLSTQQAELARARALAAGPSDRIHVQLMDYRNMPPEWEGAFDRLVSIEMVEAVGKEYMEVHLGAYMRLQLELIGVYAVDILVEGRLGAEQGDRRRCSTRNYHPGSKRVFPATFT